MGDLKRIVVKVGTAVITKRTGKIDRERLEELVDQIACARARGMDIALVSSGAIAAGMERLKIKNRPREIQELQAIASVGQGLLIRIYTDLFFSKGLDTGQILLTQSDMSHRRQYLNARATIENLFKMGVVPVINENDTVATEEITFGDNDMLAALVAVLIRSDLLVLLTDIEGLYSADPRKVEGAKLLKKVCKITPDIEKSAGEIGSEFASGGMSSKIQAAKIAVSAGVPVVIANGRKKRTLEKIINGKQVGTYFPASGRISLKKHWIGFAKESKGRIVVDDGAANAIIKKGKSLLPAGIIDVEGEFGVGDCVEIAVPCGKVIGKGLTNYNSAEARLIKGMKSHLVREVLGERAEAIIHRDSLVIFNFEVSRITSK